MKDYDHKVKIAYMKSMGIDFIPEISDSSVFKRNIYMNNQFPYNSFFMLQDLSSDKSWFIHSYNQSNKLKLV